MEKDFLRSCVERHRAKLQAAEAARNAAIYKFCLEIRTLDLVALVGYAIELGFPGVSMLLPDPIKSSSQDVVKAVEIACGLKFESAIFVATLVGGRVGVFMNSDMCESFGTLLTCNDGASMMDLQIQYVVGPLKAELAAATMIMSPPFPLSLVRILSWYLIGADCWSNPLFES